MSFVPQALASSEARQIPVIFYNEEDFNRYWKDKVKTIDASGIETHPRLLKIGDIIDFYITGWNKTKILSIDFLPDSSDIPDYHRSGSYRFETENGYLSVYVNGRNVETLPIYKF